MLRHADYCTDGFVVCFSFVFCLFFVCFGGGIATFAVAAAVVVVVAVAVAAPVDADLMNSRMMKILLSILPVKRTPTPSRLHHFKTLSSRRRP